jgi:hypothetical protein
MQTPGIQRFQRQWQRPDDPIASAGSSGEQIKSFIKMTELIATFASKQKRDNQ